jgi:DNA polymerase I-like protein with 3'-5' exonuclease and polymerase domains
MAKQVAIIEAKPSRNDYARLFDNAFEFDKYTLTSNPDITKVLKKDIDININLDDYQWVILVGSEPFKYYTKISSITAYTGRLVDGKFLPVINPGMIKFKPEAKKPWEESKTNIIKYITGKAEVFLDSSENFIGIEDKYQALEYIQNAIDAGSKYIALDSETSSLYPRDGYILGLSLTYKDDHGAYISTEVIDEEVEEKLQELFNKKLVVFHNAKFDLAFFEYHFKFHFPQFGDTMLLHYLLDETQGSHGLKELALKYTKYGDYERELEEWRADYCRKNRIKKEDFTYDLIPFDIIKTYAAKDTAVTFILFNKFNNAVRKNSKLSWVYDNILIPGCRLLTDIQENGVPFDKDRLLFGQRLMSEELQQAAAELANFAEVKKFEADQGAPFNPNSTVQLRKLLFDYIGLAPTGKLTGTGAASTDSEVLEQLADKHPIPKHILSIRKSGKIKNTYLDKIIPQLDKDERLRTNFNLHSTTSGRLSSSGKLNMQQLPRDNPAVKGCIKARPGYKIVSMDLQTAEMWVAAAISDDLELQDVFRKGGDFHSSISKRVFGLQCAVEEVKTLFTLLRQAAKAVSFGINLIRSSY